MQEILKVERIKGTRNISKIGRNVLYTEVIRE